MKAKWVLAAGLSFLVYYYWQGEKKVRVVTLESVSWNVCRMLEVRSRMLSATGVGAWGQQGQALIKKILERLNDTEQLEFQLACVYLDLRNLLDVNFNHPAEILEQLVNTRSCIMIKENEYQRLLLIYQEVFNKQNAISRDLAISLKCKSDLQCQVRTLESRLFSSDSRLKAITVQKEKEVKNALASSANVISEHTQLKRSSEQQRDRIGSLEYENSQLRRNNQALTEKLRIVEAEWQRQHEAGKKSIAEKEGKIKLLLEENQSLKHGNEALQGQLRKVGNDYSVLCKAANTKRSFLEEQLSASSLKISNLQGQCDHLKQELRKAQQTADQCNKGKVTLDNKIQLLRAEMATREQQMTEGMRRLEAKVQECQQTTDNLACVVCLDNCKEVLFMPCRHICMCEGCAENITDCPICRSRIVSKQKSFIS